MRRVFPVHMHTSQQNMGVGLANLSAQRTSSKLIAPTLTFDTAMHPPYKDPSHAYSCFRETWEVSCSQQLNLPFCFVSAGLDEITSALDLYPSCRVSTYSQHMDFVSASFL